MSLRFIVSALFACLLLCAAPTPLGAQTPPEDPVAEEFRSSGGGASNVLLSLILPGAGEWRMGRKGLAKWFIGSEMVLWLGYAGSRAYTDQLQRNLQTFAAVHAGVDSDGKNGQFWIDIGTAENIYQFNRERLLERDLNGLYGEGGSYDWQWDSEDHRLDYVGQRLNRLDWKRSTNWVVAGLVLNRIVSAIDVLRLMRQDAADEGQQSRMSVRYANDQRQGRALHLNLAWSW